jgi:hypothetical protein
MSQQKRPKTQPETAQQPAAKTPADKELSNEALDGVAGGTGNAVTVNTNRVDPYKNFNFH